MNYSIKFYLKKPKDKNETLIYLEITYKNQRTRITTQLFIKPENWDFNKKKAKARSTDAKLNDRLTKIENFAFEACFKHQNKANFHVLVKQDVLIFIQGKNEKSTKTLSFFEEWNNFIEFRKQSGYKKTTIHKYSIAYKYLYAFNPKTTYDMIDVKFLENFRNFLINEKGLAVNSVIPIIKNGLKVFLNYTLDNETHNNNKFQKFKLEVKPKRQNVYLTNSEWETIYNLEDLSPSLNNAKHWLNLMFYTGLRVSDIMELKPSHINIETKEIRKIIKKTDKDLMIPIAAKLMPTVELFLSGGLLRISEQKLNVHFKELGKLAQIDEEVVTVEYKPNKIEIVKKKYELLSCHSLRRSFATNLIEKGASHSIIRQFTGHSSLASFERYIGTTSKQATEVIRNLLD